jgi:hypothetical protein
MTGTNVDGTTIKAAILVQAERAGISADTVLAIGGGTLRDYEARHHARQQ